MREELILGILIAGTGNKAEGPTFGGEKYRAPYQSLVDEAASRGMKTYRVFAESYDAERGGFTSFYDLSDPAWPRTTDGFIQPSVLWDRAPFSFELHRRKLELVRTIPMVNDPLFSLTAASKLAPNELFSDYAIPTRVIWRQEQLEEAAEALSGDRLVAKPMIGTGGKGVHILPREQIKELTDIPPSGLVLQELVDTTVGIPGIADGPHDLRLVFVGEEVCYASVRIPPEGSLISNVARGATKHVIQPDLLPSELNEVIELIRERFAVFTHKIYSVDFLFGPDGPRVVEMNYTPGFFFEDEDRATQDRFFALTMDHLRSAISSFV
ncbi:MAG: hypothetical protein KC925_02015 [Candidatus Doudnabacteria bacterium]|nr:hypothetical protein [Candidatus Doudnabacteria bacterium]